MHPTFTPFLLIISLLTHRSTDAVHVHQRDTQSRGFHYHYEVISPSAVASVTVPPTPVSSEPAIEPLRTEESRATFGYRKPSGEYRVVDYLADGLGFNRKGGPSDTERAARLQEQRQMSTTTTTTTSTTTPRPSPIYVPSTTPSTDYEDDEDNDREMLPIPPPAPLRAGKTSPAQQARFMHQQDQESQNAKQEEQKKESRPETGRASSVKGGSKKSKDNEIKQDKVDKMEPSTIRSPLPPSTTTTTSTTTSTTLQPTVERESEAVMIRPSTGRIRERLLEPPETTSATTMEPELARIDHKMMHDERELPQNKISIHQLISQAMPTLQMSVVPVYFMNRVTRTVMAVPYLVMKSVSKMPLIPGMVDGLTPPALSGAQTLFSFANHKIQRNNAHRTPANIMSAMQSLPVTEQPMASPMGRNADVGQILESGVEEARDDDASATESSSSMTAKSATQSENNWVTIDSPVSAETLDNTWLSR